MPLARHYNPSDVEPRLQATWQVEGVYRFTPGDGRQVYSIDTPPPTVSGDLHLGHAYSYTHADLFARFWRMRGYNIFYPMGFDDNGLPTERLVERRYGVTAREAGRGKFIEKCLEVSAEIEADYRSVFQRLGLSVDWRYTFRTIDDCSRRTSQYSFLDLHRKGYIYRGEAPVIWCPECHTSLAQADVVDLERESQLITIPFILDSGEALPVATTRPELLPACVAVFVHPDDERHRHLPGTRASVPLFGASVPVLADAAVDLEKGTGAVMCCTFGDTTDINWWREHNLPNIQGIDREGRMTAAAGDYAGLAVTDARRKIAKELERSDMTLERQPVQQNVPVHERCDTPIEYLISQQWFIRVLDFKDKLLAAGEQIDWHPEHMRARYQTWVENLAWDWCISRQRTFGVPIPVWYCRECGETILAGDDQLPVDPAVDRPKQPCSCGNEEFIPEEDVLDTWATSSMTPQIVGRWLCDEGDHFYEQVFPFSLRPQGHEIIRTWAFYTITKSLHHFETLPWKATEISGWGIAGEGMGKISKSRGSGTMSPSEMMERYSADAIRYWAASTGTGKDAVISEEKIQIGDRLVTKIWNVARFSERFLGAEPQSEAENHPIQGSIPDRLSPADRWILSRFQRLIRRATQLMEDYDYAAAKSELEGFFWGELADNYLEMCKQRLYGQIDDRSGAARYTLGYALLNTLKLFAPFLPHVTEEIYRSLFTHQIEGGLQTSYSIHTSSWPVPDPSLEDARAEITGERLVEIATAVRRYKSQNGLSLGTEITRMRITVSDPALAAELEESTGDLASITRARQIEIADQIDPTLTLVLDADGIRAGIISDLS